jgi:cysteine desulfuration protein SufE
MTLDQLLTDTKPALSQIYSTDLPELSQVKDWQSKYRVLMQLGRKLPAIPEKMKQPSLLVKGCESRAWLMHYYNQHQDQHFFVLDSEARIVKGLMAIMLCLVNGMSNAELKKFNLTQAFDKLNLKPYLSQSRGSGLNAMMERIKSCCH